MSIRITKVYETETYDYPTQIQESLTELGTSISHGITNFAAANLKNTNLPVPQPAAAPEHQHKTLPHARRRSATAAAVTIHSAPSGPDDKLGKALGEYAAAWEKISDARVQHDEAIKAHFLQPWQQTLSTAINVAMRARQAVRASRLELDATKQSYVLSSFRSTIYTISCSYHSYLGVDCRLKNAGPTKQEAARIDVENAEDDLVQKTEVAITLMKTVLENVRVSCPFATVVLPNYISDLTQPEPLKNLNELAKAQLIFHATAAEALSSVQGEIEELSVPAEGEYR